MKGRATPAIALRMSNNDGGYYFMSLHTGKRIHGYQWDELPVDKYVIERVEAIAESEEQPIMSKGYPNFEWTPNERISDDLDEDFDSNYPIIDVLSKTDSFEELNEENNSILDDEENEQNINEYVINEEDSVDGIIDGNVISDDENFSEDHEKYSEENNDLEEEKSSNEEENIVLEE